VQWQIDTPAGRFEVSALLDAQELDSRASTGVIYGRPVKLRDGSGGRIGGISGDDRLRSEDAHG